MQPNTPATISPTQPAPEITQPEPEKTLISWTAPSRLYKKRNREYFGIIIALILLISIILLFAKEFLLIAVILAFGFLTYVLASVQPDSVTHTLTNKGVRTEGKFTPWADCLRFWWEEKWHQHMVHIQTPHFPHKLILLTSSQEKNQVDEVLLKYVIQEKPEPTWLDKSAAWLQEKVPLEIPDEPPATTPPPKPQAS